MAIDYSQIRTAEERQAEALAQAKESALQRTDRERDRRIALGFTWGSVPIDTRDSRDFENIQGLASMAQQLAAMGETGPVLPFRDAANFSHQLTPQEVIAIGMGAFQHKASHYTAAWALKDSISAAESVAAVETVDLEDDAAWPQTDE